MSNASNRLQQIGIHVEGPNGSQRQRQQSPWAKRIEAFVVRHRDLLGGIQVAMFIIFLCLMIGPLFLPLPHQGEYFYNNFTVFANFIIWGLWFPLVFVSVIFSGRSWCGVLCPLGASSEWANRVGLKRPVPRWVRWQGTPIISFIIITVLAQTVSARDYATGIAEVFGLTFVCAIALGLVYGRGASKRAWCRHMCPIGLMLGVFSRIGAIQLAPKLPRGDNDAYAEKGVCPTMIDINRKTESRHCIECFRCVNPDARGGLKMLFRRPGTEVEQIREHNPNAAEIWFLFLATGLSLGGFLWLVLPLYQTLRQSVGEWAINHGWFWIGTSGPAWLMSIHPAGHEVFSWLDFFMIVGFMGGCAIGLTIALTFTTAISSWVSGRLGGDLDWRSRLVELAYAYMPVAMLSLVIGLGGKLFEALTLIGVPGAMVASIKLVLFGLSVLWSLQLGYRLLGRQALSGLRRLLALVPMVAGIGLIGIAWSPALFSM
ncbi:4Fe-4S binding protein [Salinisphaera sp. USBA-960]|uniref:4Fe-4S binding protein n=1 Tax=Salinisphaera orenii TaxID=856731 RepID=UPI000DBE8AAA|nr:4Fe-4S binding protein [Salifodinibacter halophilus]NNC26607.1 4Fe-4S binding protein [Salifodinibacter halophilus]